MSDTSLFQHKKPIVPLRTSDVPKRPSFIGDAYGEITDAGYYGKSDLMSYVWGSVDKNLVLHIS